MDENKTDRGGGVFQPSRTGATMVALMVRWLLLVSEATSSPDVEERTIERRKVVA